MKTTISHTLGIFLALGLAACGDDGGTQPGIDVGPGVKDSGFVTFDSGSPLADSGVPVDTGVVVTDTGVVDTGVITNCDQNPNGCVPNQLRSAAPACTCLAGCEPGYNWTGAACEANVPTDAGVDPDGAAPTDSGTPEDAGTPTDAGDVDGGTPADVGPADTGTPDTGTPDTGAPDTGVADVGNQPDAGFGFGANENEACNPQANDCRQRPGLVCQNTDPQNPGSTTGICLASCDVGANQPNGTNAACTGVGLDCADAFDLGPTNGRCVNTVGAFEVLDGTIELGVCDPTPGNLFFVPSDGNFAGSPGVCWPLCLARASSTNPDLDPPTCVAQGPYPSCNDEIAVGGDPADPTSNVYGLCNAVSTRNGPCGADRGLQCPGTDLCLFNVCRESLGTTCTGAPACATAGQACVQLGQTAVCHQPCGINTGTPACPSGQTCALFSVAGQPLESCRLSSGALAANGDCSDVLGIGTNNTDCGPGTVCQEEPSACNNDGECPFGQFCNANICRGYGAASCLAYCNPTSPTTCQAAETCTAYDTVPPFDAYGLCL